MYSASKANEDMERFKGRSTLQLIQSIPTIPNAFPKQLNTCGRICIHNSGRFVIVSNRGHQSIVILRVNQHNGQLSTVGYFHTRGETPRHFKFDNSGQYLIVANQDSNNLSIFNFNQSSGEIKFTGNDYNIPSPNFICCCLLHNDGVNADLNVKNKVIDNLEIMSKRESAVMPMEGIAELKNTLSKAREKVKYLESQIAMMEKKK